MPPRRRKLAAGREPEAALEAAVARRLRAEHDRDAVAWMEARADELAASSGLEAALRRTWPLRLATPRRRRRLILERKRHVYATASLVSARDELVQAPG